MSDFDASSARTMKRYLLMAGVALLGLLLVNAALCVFADPYFVLGTPTIVGLTRDKTAATSWPRLSKAYLVARARPRTILIGSSTTDIGFNPESHVWPTSMRPVFNLGIDGALPDTELAFLRHALAASHPAQVFLAVSFIDSVQAVHGRPGVTVAGQAGYQDRLLVRPDGSLNPEHARAQFDDLVFSTVSFTATLDSLSTLLKQNSRGATRQTELGWNNGAIFTAWARQDGPYGLFMNKDREKIAQFSRFKDGMVVQLAPVARMVQACNEAHTKLVVVVLPSHSDAMEALHLLGFDAAYDAWKTNLMAGIYQAGGDVAVWDFSGFNPYTTETIPSPADRSSSLKWFWEPIHFKVELGDLMVSRMLGAPQPAQFGVLLTRAKLPAEIAEFHTAERQWASAHPADVGRIQAIVVAQ